MTVGNLVEDLLLPLGDLGEGQRRSLPLRGGEEPDDPLGDRGFEERFPRGDSLYGASDLGLVRTVGHVAVDKAAPSSRGTLG